MKPIERPFDKAILKPEEAARKFDLKLYAPSAELAGWIEHYWTLTWDLRGDAPFSQKVLSYPSINLTLENENGASHAEVYGVPRGTFTRTLTGYGECFSAKFRPGGFYPFWRESASRLTGRKLPLEEIFGASGEALAGLLSAVPASEARLAAMERWLLGFAPERDGSAELAGRIVQDAASDRSLLHVEAMASRHGMSVRTLQRLLGRYIGVSPKWILQRFRLQEAAERIRQEKLQDWAGLSMELGYYDQAHFTRDFKAVVGVPPETYVRGLG
ncbi:Helix-turn-helix domain-containing protein [Cohnella sp. OV330]|uniref:helix-turn-helix domain-containing protein n=1 Tax=Cohnella sp. OV330 TaxID=1855288 RepID=UPI0008F302D7|nr:AraC family transcriptional regulator [Cohnella sp. OV330]SFB59004.1 Helix-turn-helix domain-containing protein [Cohnella sp. OV330]